MNKTITFVALAALMAVGTLPVVSANSTIVEDALEKLACNYTGPQGTITSAPTSAGFGGAYWIGPYYYADYSVTYTDIDRYNYCVANIQVGAVSTSYGYRQSYHTCVNCVATVGIDLA